MIQATAAKLPFGAGQIAKESNKELEQFGNSVNQLADTYNPNVQTLEDAGNVVQNNLSKWVDNYKDANTSNWKTTNNIIGKQTPVDVSNTANALNTLSEQAGDNEAARDFLNSSLAKDIAGVISETKPVNVSTNSFTNLAESQPQPKAAQPLQWQTVQGLRSRIGEYLSDPYAIADAGQAQAKMLYGALSQDMQGTAQKVSPEALQSFMNSNAFTTHGHQFIQDIVSPAMKANPENAAKALLNSGTLGGTTLQALRQEAPDAADALSAVSLRRAMAGQSEGSSNAVSPLRWLSNQDPSTRLAPEASNALFPDPADRDIIDALNQVALAKKNTSGFANPSGTGTHAATAFELSAPFTGAALGYEHGGLHGALAGAGLGSIPIGVGYGAGKISANQTLARFLSTPSDNSTGLLANKASQALANALSANSAFTPYNQGR